VAGIHIALSAAWVGPYGANGLITADAVNMVLRIAYSLRFASKRFRDVPSFSLRALLPDKETLRALTVASLMVMCSANYLLEREGLPAWEPTRVLETLGLLPDRFDFEPYRGWSFPARAALHVLAGAVMFLMPATAIWAGERRALDELRTLRSHRD
jgi:Rft protein